MNLITVMVLALLAPLALLGAFRANKLAPTTRNRVLVVSMLLAAFAVVLVAALLVPDARMLDTNAEALRAQVRLDTRLTEVRELSKALGGPQAYIEYLKATKAA
ncbi:MULTISPECIES: hypothetical protein [Pseudomonas]|uniref:hypothetical protein n=1 Tax=Pseudomonas TaxID=286 RepID=UPI001475F7D1|nr:MULTISPECIES: hypothetical protein [Pseudomonas]MBM1204776.1 hypothetical protein [Pseudomonas fragi]MBM1204872.1 hypothetical protein [Pseudomonas fragi]NMY57952.1 hypothetical protein [Pseudomonas sp. WS 5051]